MRGCDRDNELKVMERQEVKRPIRPGIRPPFRLRSPGNEMDCVGGLMANHPLNCPNYAGDEIDVSKL